MEMKVEAHTHTCTCMHTLLCLPAFFSVTAMIKWKAKTKDKNSTATLGDHTSSAISGLLLLQVF